MILIRTDIRLEGRRPQLLQFFTVFIIKEQFFAIYFIKKRTSNLEISAFLGSLRDQFWGSIFLNTAHSICQ
jgi:hypothetical protein